MHDGFFQEPKGIGKIMAELCDDTTLATAEETAPQKHARQTLILLERESREPISACDESDGSS